MADYENAFVNPFEDTSVQQASQATHAPRMQPEFNPFNGQNTARPVNQNQNYPPTVPPPQPSASQVGSQAVPPPYTPAPWENKAAMEELERRQVELERKAQELERREQAMQRNVQAQERKNNFPPLPSCLPIQPCFYQDFSIDIPNEFQRIIRLLYYAWIAYACLLLLNMIGSLSYFIATTQSSNLENGSGKTFGLSILYLVLFTPCSFICWFRPVYNAFRIDSSFNFLVFFFIFFFQFCTCIIQCIGIDGLGSVGIWNSMEMFSRSGDSVGLKAVGGMMFIIGVLFGLAAALDMIMLLRVHNIYRSKGASFAKAQSEFAQGVMSNRTVQEAAGNMAASAARESLNPSNRP